MYIQKMDLMPKDTFCNANLGNTENSIVLTVPKVVKLPIGHI